jgi:hypothetical protein
MHAHVGADLYIDADRMDAAALAENIRGIIIDGSDDTPVLDEHGHGCTREPAGIV